MSKKRPRTANNVDQRAEKKKKAEIKAEIKVEKEKKKAEKEKRKAEKEKKKAEKKEKERAKLEAKRTAERKVARQSAKFLDYFATAKASLPATDQLVNGSSAVSPNRNDVASGPDLLIINDR